LGDYDCCVVARTAICISHATGAGGEDVGRVVAEQLGFRYVDDEVIAAAAEWAELDPAVVASAERRRPLVARMLGRIAEQTASTRLPTGPATRALPTDADLRALIGDVLRASAEEGSVVLVAHAASFALGAGDALRVFVTASSETRARRIAEARGLDTRAAQRALREEDAGRADYLRRFYGVEQELPVHYDVVVNTDVLAPGAAAEVVVAATR
jgi:cytidylate kinase